MSPWRRAYVSHSLRWPNYCRPTAVIVKTAGRNVYVNLLLFTRYVPKALSTLSPKTATVAERIRWLSPFSVTIVVDAEIGDYSRQCGQALTRNIWDQCKKNEYWPLTTDRRRTSGPIHNFTHFGKFQYHYVHRPISATHHPFHFRPMNVLHRPYFALGRYEDCSVDAHARRLDTCPTCVFLQKNK